MSLKNVPFRNTLFITSSTSSPPPVAVEESSHRFATDICDVFNHTGRFLRRFRCLQSPQ